MRITFAIVVLSLLTAPALAQPAEIATENGAVGGAVTGGVGSWKGIPFAAPPVGDLRWRAPQPAAAWEGVRDGTAFGPSCMQTPLPGDSFAPTTPLSEDCLSLNVWSPDTSASLPVMVWIHGGGWTIGGSSAAGFDGARLAARGVVVVSFNYRLGRFGYFAHPALTAENADSGRLGNYGLLDQIAALEWVKRNIAGFGGDPARVTIFGQSAGAGSVLMLMASPSAKGLFSAAIAESSPFGGALPGLLAADIGIRTPGSGAPSAEVSGKNFAVAAGVPEDDVAKLRAIPAERLLEGIMFIVYDKALYSGPMVDGTVLPTTVAQAFAAGAIAAVPLLAGATDGEVAGLPFPPEALAARFAAMPPEMQATVTKLYNPAGDRAVGDVVADLLGDIQFVSAARSVVRGAIAAGAPAWTYRFGYLPEAVRGAVRAAPHTAEIRFVFGTLDGAGVPVTPADQMVADTLLAYWANFAIAHDPNGDGLPAWPPATADGEPVLLVTNDGIAAGPDPFRPRLDALDLLARMMAGR